MALKLGEIVVLVYGDAIGAGPRIISALSSAQFERSVSLVNLSLASYAKGDDLQITVEVVNFINCAGIPQISVVNVQEFPEGMCTCAVHEVLEFIVATAPSDSLSFSIFLPAAGIFPSSMQSQLGDTARARVAAYNDALGVRRQMVNGLKDIPKSTQIKDEFMACFIHLVNVMEVPSLLLILPLLRVSPLDKKEIAYSKQTAIEEVCHLGGVLADMLGLNFNADTMDKHIKEDSFVRNLVGNDHTWSGLYA